MSVLLLTMGGPAFEPFDDPNLGFNIVINI